MVIEGILDPITSTDHGSFHFVGGTGRFEGASGSADFVATINPLTGAFELTMVGRIDYWHHGITLIAVCEGHSVLE